MSDPLHPEWVQLTHREPPRLLLDVRADAIFALLPVSANPSDGTKVFIDGLSESTADSGRSFVVAAESHDEIRALLRAHYETRKKMG